MRVLLRYDFLVVLMTILNLIDPSFTTRHGFYWTKIVRFNPSDDQRLILIGQVKPGSFKTGPWELIALHMLVSTLSALFNSDV